LQTVAPRLVVISAGYQNRYGHPHKQVLERYWQQGIAWYNTAIHGQIRIRLNDDGQLLVEHAYY
jgi:competence protein ComEC